MEAYQQLDAEQQARVQRWIHLNKFVAQTLRIDWRDWIDTYIGAAMERPFDYSFMEATVPNFAGFDGAAGQGVSFTTEMDPATQAVSRVPLRAQNNLGRLSPDLQDAIAGTLDGTKDGQTSLGPADVVHLQKIFRAEKALGRLKRKDFRNLLLGRDADDVIIEIQGGEEILRMSVIEFGAVMGKALV